MRERARRTRGVAAVAAAAAAAILGLALPARCARAAAETPGPCSGPEYHRLDFWIGDWDAYDVEDRKTLSARTRVEAILGGCALKETYEGTNGLVGQSFTTYDATRKAWHQTWVTNRGRLLMIEGRFDGGTLTLQGPQTGAGGRKELIRGTWKREGDGVREIAHTSDDGGATWRPLFDILFLPHKTGAAAPDKARGGETAGRICRTRPARTS